jgi:uncharacterized membrane protein YgcG
VARRAPLLLVALAFGISALGLLAHPSPVGAWSAGTFSSTAERQLVALTNQARAAAGRRSLRVDSVLTSLARWRSKDMITRGYFSHRIPGGGTVFDVMQRKGYCFKLAGENIGWNSYPDDVATRAVHEQFMNSSGHRANVLGAAWDVIGVGAYKGPTGKKMYTVIFADKCGATVKPTPKPTPRPTAKPKPRATPKPTPRPTARPKPTLKPTAKPTAAPTPTPTPSPTPQPAATRPPEPADPDLGGGAGLGPGGQGNGSGSGGENGNGGSSGNGPPPGQESRPSAPPAGLRVHDPPAATGLVDSLLGGLAGFLFGG